MILCHYLQNLQCHVCENAFANIDQLRHHITSCGANQLRCNQCGIQASQGNRYIEHRETCTGLNNTGMPQSICPHCEKNITMSSSKIYSASSVVRKFVDHKGKCTYNPSVIARKRQKKDKVTEVP